MMKTRLFVFACLISAAAHAGEIRVETNSETGKEIKVIRVFNCENTGDLTTCYTANRSIKVEIDEAVSAKIAKEKANK